MNHCGDCGQPGLPYEYRGRRFDGLIAYKGDRVCPGCADARAQVDGVDILVVDDRPSVPAYVYNTVRDADKVQVVLPPELRGVDGRDMARRGRRARS